MSKGMHYYASLVIHPYSSIYCSIFYSTHDMGLFLLLRDMCKYPRDNHKETNRFHELLTFLLRDYPAFLWTKPSLLRVIVFPLFLLYFMFKE